MDLILPIAIGAPLAIVSWFSIRRWIKTKDQLASANNDVVKYKVLAEQHENTAQQLQQSVDSLAREKDRLQTELASVNTRIEDERKTAQEKIDLLTDLRESMTSKFSDAARDALKVQGEEFSKTNLEKVFATIEPYKKALETLRTDLNSSRLENVKERAVLSTQIEALSKDTQDMSKITEELTKALKTDTKKQGAWGEIVLERILESSGLRKDIEYTIQAPRKDEDGKNLRPDVVVNLSEDKTLVIDSKVSITDYLNFEKATTDLERSTALKKHVASLQRHIDDLSSKSYQILENRTVDYVVLFLPYESALSSTLNEKNDLVSYAYEKNIMLATPTTLLMALRTVAHVWSTERRNQNAEAIANRAGRLYDKLSMFIDSFVKVSDNIDQARNSLDKAFGQLKSGQGNVIAQVETLKKLGAKSTKSIKLSYDSEEAVIAESTKQARPHQQ